MVRIAKPNSTPQTDIYWVLNLACLKHTGQCLPQDLLPANTWKYKTHSNLFNADGTPYKIAKLFIPRLSPCFFNDLTLQIKRSLVVDQLNSIFNYSKEKKRYKRSLQTFQSLLRNENCLFSGGSIKPEYFNADLVRKLDDRTQLFRSQHFNYLTQRGDCRSTEHQKVMEIISYHLIERDVIGHELITFIKKLNRFFRQPEPSTPKAVFEYDSRLGFGIGNRTIPVMSYVFQRTDYTYLPHQFHSGYNDFRWGVTMPKEYSLAEDTNSIVKYHNHHPKGIWFHKRNSTPTFYKNQNKHLSNSNEYEFFKYLFCAVTKNSSSRRSPYQVGFYDHLRQHHTDYWTLTMLDTFWKQFKSGDPLNIEQSMRIFAQVRPQPTLPWEEGSVVQVC